MHLAEQMTDFDNIDDCEDELTDFSAETNATFWIEDSNGYIIYPNEASPETSTVSADQIVTFDQGESFIDMQPSGTTTTNFYPITLKNGTTYTLAVQTDLLVVQQATKVLLSILPYVILMVFVLALLCAWLYTAYITRPIVRLSKISKQMAELDFSGQCDIAREDELGCLAQNLNSLSTSLSTALNDLQIANQQLITDIEKEQALEQQRVDFFSAASHELKTPLTILEGHLTGMLNGVRGYENHTEYMERSLAVVDRMEKLVKELLYVSKAEGTQKSKYKIVDFAEVFRVQIAAVSDLLEEKKQHIEVNIPDRLYCEVEQVQMERAIQNILVNAIRYSPSNELIRVTLAEIHGTIRGEIENKVKAIEMIDEHILGPVVEFLKGYDDFAVLVCPDHPTPLSIRTHTSTPVPYLIYDSKNEINSGVKVFCEKEARETGNYIEKGFTMMNYFLTK